MCTRSRSRHECSTPKHQKANQCCKGPLRLIKLVMFVNPPGQSKGPTSSSSSGASNAGSASTGFSARLSQKSRQAVRLGTWHSEYEYTKATWAEEHRSQKENQVLLEVVDHPINHKKCIQAKDVQCSSFISQKHKRTYNFKFEPCQIWKSFWERLYFAKCIF